jgi:hypothetical protein
LIPLLNVKFDLDLIPFLDKGFGEGGRSLADLDYLFYVLPRSLGVSFGLGIDPALRAVNADQPDRFLPPLFWGRCVLSLLILVAI